jgi:hypothetical protein
MTIQVKVLKPTAYFPLAGKVYEVEPSPRVRVLLHKGYIAKVDGPQFRDYDPVLKDEPEVEVPILADDHETVEKDEAVVESPEAWVEIPAVEETKLDRVDDRAGWLVPEDDDDYVAFGVTNTEETAEVTSIPVDLAAVEDDEAPA